MTSLNSKSNDGVSMSDCLGESSPFEALLSVSAVSESLAMALANDLAASISMTSPSSSTTANTNTKDNSKAKAKKRNSQKKNPNEEKDSSELPRYPIPLPSSLQFTTNPKMRTPSNTSVDTALVCSESILSSLSKIAHGGSKASTEMRQLEDQRYHYDKEATDISNALKLRDYAQLASSALSSHKFKKAAQAIQSYRQIPATTRAKEYAGKSTQRQYTRAQDVLQRSIMEKYEMAVIKGDLNGLSELTPLLGMLHLADKGVALYLRYSKDALYDAMDKAATTLPSDAHGHAHAHVHGHGHMEEDADGKRLSRRKQQERQLQQLQQQEAANNTICGKLAKVFNAGVTHLRHHLPMVASALGNADGDAALVQLVHLEVEKRANEFLKQYAQQQKLSTLEIKAERVMARMEEKYVNGMGLDREDDTNPNDSMNDGGFGYYNNNEEMNDCGFKANLGNLADLDQLMDETALALQHTESYERFIRHAVDQVLKARELRIIKMRKEREWKKQQMEDDDPVTTTTTTNANANANADSSKQEEEKHKEQEEEEEGIAPDAIEILPTHTQLNEIVAEIGGCYSGLEHVLLLASMQRAFLNSDSIHHPEPNRYSPMGIISSNTGNSNDLSNHGRNALQTSIVEECLYAAQRSTMRAFATGHSGTACAAANFCSDALGRMFLEVLIRKAEESTAALKPGEGLLEGNGGLGQAALSVINSGQKRLRNAGGGGKVEENNLDSAEMKYKIYMGISYACARYNDLEVAAEYTKRLESQFLSEIDSTFPPGNMTEQLRMCVKSLTPVHESFKNASKRCIEQLVIQILPRVRSIANDSVGQEGTATTSFMSSSVMGGGASNVSLVKMNYDLDDKAYELAQISEGYMRKMCSALDDLLHPLRMQLAPHLSDAVVLGAIGGASKRIESAIRRSRFTALGALSLDSDIRYFINYAKERLDSPEYASTVTLYAACNPLARLSQIALLMNVDDLEDVLDLISSSKRKGNWDLKLDDAKSLLNMRDDFEGRKVNELLRVSDVDE